MTNVRLLWLVVTMGIIAPLHTQAQTPFPNRAMRIIIPTAPGGGNDLTGRLLAQWLAERYGVPVVPENRTGAGTVIGNDIVAKAKPDGHTLLIAPAALAITPTMNRQMPYDAARACHGL